MSRAGGDPLLITKVEVQADLQPMDAGLAQAKVKAQKAAAEIGATMQRGGAGGGPAGVAGSVGRAGGAVKGVDQELRAGAGRILGIAGAATAAVAVIDRLIASYNRFKNAGRDLVNQSDAIGKALGAGSDINVGLSEAQKRAVAIGEATRQIRKDIEAAGDLGGVVDGVDKVALGAATMEASTTTFLEKMVAAVSPAALIYQLLRKGTEETQKQAEAALEKAQRDAEAREEARKRNEQEVLLKESRKRVVEIQNEELEGINKLNAEYRKAINDIDARRKDASTELLASLDDEARAEKANYDKRVARLVEERRQKAESDRQSREESERQAREAAERQARALADAYSSAIGRIQQEAIAAFSAERLTGAVETLLDRVEAIAEQRRNIRG